MIKKRILFLSVFILMTGFFTFGNFRTAKAYEKYNGTYDQYSEICKDDATNSTICQERSNTDPITGPNPLIPKIANIISVIGGIVAIVIIMLSGLKLITANGDSKKYSEARTAIIYAAVGLVVIALSRLIIQYILRYI